ncbi:MAG: hypothetical protein V4448_01295 [Pseudomonadota bacterium]
MRDKQQEKKCIPDSWMQKGYDLRYPTDISRFDDNFSHEGLAPVRDVKILNKLKLKCEEAKILWEAADQSSIYNLEDVFDLRNDSASYVFTQHKQFLVYLHLAVSYAKLLTSNGRLNRHRSLLLEAKAIYSFYVDSFNKAKFCLESWQSSYDLNFSHPFAKLIFLGSPDTALQEVQSAIYKKEEALFIRVSNADQKIILDTLSENLARNKNVVIHRFQISTEVIFAPHTRIDSSQFKSDLNIVFDRINHLSNNNLICAINSIFPSALSQTGLQGFEGTIGHLALIFSKNAFTQNKNLFSSLQNSSLNDGIVFGAVAMDPTQDGYRSKAVGNLSSSHPRQALEQLADYMTIERRYLRPGFRIPSVPSLAPFLKQQQHTLFVKQFK